MLGVEWNRQHTRITAQSRGADVMDMKAHTCGPVIIFLLIDAAVRCITGSHVCPHHMGQLIPAPYTQHLQGCCTGSRPASHTLTHPADVLHKRGWKTSP